MNAESPSVFAVLSLSVAAEPAKIRQPLRPNGQEIRVMQLCSGRFRLATGREHVSCYTKVVPFSDAIKVTSPYIALSYVWGDANDTVPIYLDNRITQVTRNLEAALRSFESHNDAITLWADAICINQADDAEKSHQVRIMAQIYSRAVQVWVWLGPRLAGDKMDETFATIEGVAQGVEDMQREYAALTVAHRPSWGVYFSSHIVEVLTRSFSPNNFDVAGIWALLDKPWFRRVWVLQEGALNDHVFLHVGKLSLARRRLYLAVKLITLIIDRLPWTGLRAVSGGAAHSRGVIVAMNTLDYIEKASNRNNLELTLLGTLVDLGQESYGATDPRDRVFALLGGCSQAKELGLLPDYDKPCADVYTGTATALFRVATTLDLLAACSGPKNCAGLPSWVPNWTATVPLALGKRSAGNSRYCAAGHLSRCRPRLHDDATGRSLLTLSGWQFDTVAHVLAERWGDDLDTIKAYDDGELVEAFIAAVMRFNAEHVTAYNGADRDEAMCCTLIAANDIRSEHVPRGEHPQSKGPEPHTLAALRILAGLDRGPDGLDAVARSDWRFYASGDYLTAMAQVSVNRRLFCTASGYLGLSPKTVVPGDVVSILLGGDAPFVVRPTGEYFEVLGEAYVHGIMYGEFVRTNPEVRDFILC